MLDLVDEALHQVTLSVYMLIVLPPHLAVGPGWNYRDCSAVPDDLEEIIGVLCPVCNHMVTGVLSYQSLCLGDVMDLSCCQLESQRVPQAIHTHVDFGAEPCSAAAKGLRPLTTGLLRGSSGTGMSTYHRTINNDMLHIRVIGKVVMHSVPDALLAPTDKPFVDGVPLAVLLWQQSPLGTASRDPQDAFDEAPALGFLPYVHV